MRVLNVFATAAAVAAAASLALAPTVAAHGERPPGSATGPIGDLRATLESAPAIRGLEIRLLQGPAPGLFVHNATGRTLEVLEERGRAAIRVGPRGVHRRVGPRGSVRWLHLSAQPMWAWVERQARLGPHEHALMSRATQPLTLRRWTTQLRLGRRDLRVRGRVDWIPAARRHAASTAAWLLAGSPATALLSWPGSGAGDASHAAA